MAGTVTGGKAATKTIFKRHGKDFYKRIGAMGGATPTKKPKGFAVDNRSWLDKLLRKPKRAALAGKRGGHRSRRRKAEA